MSAAREGPKFVEVRLARPPHHTGSTRIYMRTDDVKYVALVGNEVWACVDRRAVPEGGIIGYLRSIGFVRPAGDLLHLRVDNDYYDLRALCEGP